MGGHAVGELASKIAADTIPHTFFKSNNDDVAATLKEAIETANAKIHERGSLNQDFERMGTTCTVLALSASGAVIGHVGDSRLYRIRDRRIDQLSFDHSLQWELLQQGRMKPEEIYLHEPRHVITRSLGPEPQVKVDIEGPYPVLPGDTYLICSDGLTGHVNDQEIGMICNGLPPADASRLLVNLSNLRGGSDNITAVVVRIGSHPQGDDPTSHAIPKPPSSGMNWKWLAGFWAAAILFVTGVCLMLFDRMATGMTMAVLSVAATVYLTYRWLRQRPMRRQAENVGDETVLWRAYRTADARLTRKFLSHLVAIQSELHRTATEEGWEIDWKQHESEFTAAKTALDAGESSGAFLGFANTIDILMAGVLEQRKQTKHEQRWGKVATSTPEKSENDIEVTNVLTPELRDSRFMRAARCEAADTTPVWIMRQAGRYLPEYMAVRSQVTFLELCKRPDLAAEVTLTAQRVLGVDAAILFADLLPILEPMGFDLEYQKGEGPVIHNPLKSAGDVDRVHELADVDVLGFVFETVKLVRKDLPADIPLLGFAGAPFTLASYAIEGGSSRNFVDTKTLMYGDPAAWEALMQRFVPSLTKYLNAQIEAGCQAVQIFDSWVGCLSPADYRRYVLPYTKAVIDGLTPGTPVINFLTGNPALLSAQREAGGQVMGVDWRVDLKEAWATFGGGITGLAAAHRVLELSEQHERPVQLTLFEAGDQPGGVVGTRRIDKYVVELGADSFITNKPWAVNLCRRLGIEDQLIPTDDTFRRSLVLRQGQPVAVPEGFMLLSPAKIWPVLSSPLFSPLGKLRMGLEYFLPRAKAGEDESLASFVRRRFGREALERLVQPLVGGIYTSDPERLSLKATLPRFLDMERDHRSLIRASRKQASTASREESSGSGARYGLFATLRNGLSSLFDVLTERIAERADIRFGTPVSHIVPAENGWMLRTADGGEETFDAVIAAARSYQVGDMVAGFDEPLAESLRTIEYASTAVVVSGHRLEDVEHPLDAFGLVVPAIENRKVLAISFTSRKFPGRAPEGHVLLRTFVGGAMQPELLQHSDDEIRRIVRDELASILGVGGEPDFIELTRYTNAMPQYHLGHLERVAAIESRVASHAGLAIAGNAYHGVGLPDCIHSGEQAAESIMNFE
eukprot:g26716.t1